MILFLILGAILGAAFIIFVLQNITPITVTFFTYHLSGSLSVILFLSLIAGMLISILILLPSFIRDEVRVNRLKRQNKDLEDELISTKNTIADLAARPTLIQTNPSEPTLVL